MKNMTIVRALKQAEKNGGREKFGKVAKLLGESNCVLGKVRTTMFIVPNHPKTANDRVRTGMVDVLAKTAPHFLREGEKLPNIEDIVERENVEKHTRARENRMVPVDYVRMLGPLNEIKNKKDENLNELEIYNKSNEPLIETHYHKRLIAGATALIATGGIIATYAAAKLFPEVIGMTADTVNFLKNNVDTYVRVATGGVIISAILYANFIGKYVNNHIRDLRNTLSDIVEDYVKKEDGVKQV